MDAEGCVCVTNGTAGAASRKQIAVGKCDPASWEGLVQLFWTGGGGVKVYTDASGGAEVASGMSFANESLPTNLWVEGTAPSAAVGDVVFRLNPVEAVCPNAAEGCDRGTMTVVRVDVDVDGLAEAEEETVPGGVVCVTNAPNRAVSRRRVTVQKAEPSDWDGEVKLAWIADNIRMCTASNGAGEVSSGVTFANAALPTNLWVEGTAASATAGDVILKVTPVGVTCNHADTGCDWARMTMILVDVDVDGLDDPVEEDSPGALVCVTNGPGQTAIRKQITVQQVEPSDWEGDVELLWTAGKVKVYTAPSNGVEVMSGTTFANTALPTNLWVEGIAVSDTAGDVVFRLNPRDVDCPHTATGCDRVVMTLLKVALMKVSFSGADNHTLLSDDQITTFSFPHYFDANMDGDANDAGERSYPVCYTRNTKMRAEANFKVAPSPTAAAIKIRGDGPGNIDIPETIGTLDDDTITLAATEAENTFPNEIDLMKPMTINWQVSFDGGSAWCHAGKSTNILYVTWDSPEQARPIQTLVDVGCDAADGQTGTVGTNDDDVLAKVWTRFQTKSIHRASDAVVLTYYGFYDANHNGTWDAGVDADWNDPESNKVQTATGLIRTANGQCHSWAEFMNEVMKAQGLSSINGVTNQRVYVYPKILNDLGFAVNNWAKTGNNCRLIIDEDAGVDGTSPTAPNPANDEAADAAGKAGHGNSPNPPSNFNRHWITKLNGKFYDPSYGLGPYTDRKAYEEAAFSGRIVENVLYFLWDLPADNFDPADHSDEINCYIEQPYL